MTNIFFISGKLETVKQTALLIFLLLSLLLIPVVPVLAQEPERPAIPKSTIEYFRNVSKDTCIEPKENAPMEKIPEVIKLASETENHTEKEKPKDEEIAESETLISGGGRERASTKFEIPSQPKASPDQSTGVLIHQYPINLKYNSRQTKKPGLISLLIEPRTNLFCFSNSGRAPMGHSRKCSATSTLHFTIN